MNFLSLKILPIFFLYHRLPCRMCPFFVKNVGSMRVVQTSPGTKNIPEKKVGKTRPKNESPRSKKTTQKSNFYSY